MDWVHTSNQGFGMRKELNESYRLCQVEKSPGYDSDPEIAQYWISTFPKPINLYFPLSIYHPFRDFGQCTRVNCTESQNNRLMRVLALNKVNWENNSYNFLYCELKCN